MGLDEAHEIFSSLTFKIKNKIVAEENSHDIFDGIIPINQNISYLLLWHKERGNGPGFNLWKGGSVPTWDREEFGQLLICSSNSDQEI